ncbi:MAG: hypothetical protein ABIO55_10750 [Ginsengibacter sp.]
MEALFTFKLSEFNNDVVQKIKDFAYDDSAIVTINISDKKDELYSTETKEEFISRIQSRIDAYHTQNKYSEEDSFSAVNEPEP